VVAPVGLTFSEDLVRRGIMSVSEGKKHGALFVAMLCLTLTFLSVAVSAGAAESDPAVAKGKMLLDQKRFPEAVTELSAVIAQDPKLREAYRLRAIAYRSMKQYDASISDYNKAIELDPQNYDAYVGRAQSKREMKNCASALDDLATALKLAPQKEIARLLMAQGTCKYDIGDFAGALETCSQSKQMSISPENANCVGRAYLKLGQYEKALQEFDAMIQANAGLSFAFYNRALAYLELGNAEKSRKDFDKALELKPEIAKFTATKEDLAKLAALEKKGLATGEKPAAPAPFFLSPEEDAANPLYAVPTTINDRVKWGFIVLQRIFI
jgi:tetratricopeptide (TPR) repeat protein